jgi:hypothetical protein
VSVLGGVFQRISDDQPWDVAGWFADLGLSDREAIRGWIQEVAIPLLAIEGVIETFPPIEVLLTRFGSGPEIDRLLERLAPAIRRAKANGKFPSS